MSPTATAPPPPPAVADVLDALHELVVAQRRVRGRDASAPGELTFAQLWLLAGLDDAGAPAGRLAAQAGVSPATATGMLDTLEQMGVVTRERSAADRRCVVATLTPEGRRLRDDKRAEARRAFEEALRGEGARDLRAGARVLRLLAAAIETL